ncbi:MAG: hypothetical protein U0359_16495 [Byssovorax sp.]
MRSLRPALLLLVLAGCDEAALLPPVSPATGERAAAEAIVSSPAGVDLATSLRDPALMRALGEELGQPVREPPGEGVTAEITHDRGHVQLVLRAPDRLGALLGCKAWLRLATGRAAQRGDRDPAEMFLRDEVARLEGEIAALDRQLSLLPATVTDGPRARDEALTLVRVQRLEATVQRRHESPSASTTFPLAAALGKLAVEARQKAAEARASGLGPAHPSVQGFEARAAFFEARQKAQWPIEEDDARALEEAIAALPPRADAMAVRRALGPIVRRSTVDRCSAEDPRPLQILALERALLLADDEEDKLHYGKNHPRRLALAARLAEQEAAFNRERDTEATLLEHGVPAGGDARPEELRDKAALLASTLARLVQQRDAARPARAPDLTVDTPCHLR